MTIISKRGNQPDPDDMSNPFEQDGDANSHATSNPTLAEEDGAARLDDFA